MITLPDSRFQRPLERSRLSCCWLVGALILVHQSRVFAPPDAPISPVLAADTSYANIKHGLWAASGVFLGRQHSLDQDEPLLSWKRALPQAENPPDIHRSCSASLVQTEAAKVCKSCSSKEQAYGASSTASAGSQQLPVLHDANVSLWKSPRQASWMPSGMVLALAR